MDRQLKIGSTYRHWKVGHLYKVLDSIEMKTQYQNGMALRLEGLGYAILSTPMHPGDIAVIYEDTAGHKFAREKSSFLEVLEGQGSNYYRFEEAE